MILEREYLAKHAGLERLVTLPVADLNGLILVIGWPIATWIVFACRGDILFRESLLKNAFTVPGRILLVLPFFLPSLMVGL